MSGEKNAEKLDLPFSKCSGKIPTSFSSACPIYRNKTTIFGAIEVTNKNNANDDDQDATGASVAFTDDDCKLLEFLTSLIGRGMYHSYCKNEEELLKLVKQGIERVASIEEEENNTAAQNN